MPENLKELARESLEKFLKSLPPEKRLEGLSAEEIARAISPETLEALRQQPKANGPSPKPQ